MYEERQEGKGKWLRWSTLLWFCKWITGNRGSGQKETKKREPRFLHGISKYSLDRRQGDRDSLGSKRSSFGRFRRSASSSRSKSMSFDITATSVPKHPRRSAIDLTACRRDSGVLPVSNLKSVDSILADYSFFVTCHRGSHAKIIKARNRHNGSRVVLKVYDKERLMTNQLDSIAKEIKLLKMAKGFDGIVRLLGSYEDSNQAIAVLEECTGGTLISHIVANGGRLSEKYCIQLVVRPLLMVLSWLHKRGIVFRDLKPEHIMFDESGRMRVVDLFSAAIIGEDQLIGREGSLSYMAPEMVNKPARADDTFHEIIFSGLDEADLPAYNEKVDIWGLGVIVFEALTGRQPFLAESCQEMVSVHNEVLATEDGIRSSLDNIRMKDFMSDGAVDFLNKVLRLNPVDRPSAVELMNHPWVQMTTIIPPACRGSHNSIESIRSSCSEDIVYTECF